MCIANNKVFGWPMVKKSFFLALTEQMVVLYLWCVAHYQQVCVYTDSRRIGFYNQSIEKGCLDLQCACACVWVCMCLHDVHAQKGEYVCDTMCVYVC